jgi:hypothetical protein
MVKFSWFAIDVDDYVCHVDVGAGGGSKIVLRVEKMNVRQWWWNVAIERPNGSYDDVHAADMEDGHNFPSATTWQDACYFAELVAQQAYTHGNFQIYYLPHAKLSRRKKLATLPRIKGPRFAPFPPVPKSI